MPVYRSTGHLTDVIPGEHVHEAQNYLTEDDMTQYLDPPLDEAVEHIVWNLHADGYHYDVTAFALRELTEPELKQLASWTSGQNSDGLGEGFEQQDFAWNEDGAEEEDCYDCHGMGSTEEGDCETCDGLGYFEPEDTGHMVSFDWKTNDSQFERMK